ncbi:MAG: hypothetical protein Q8W48_09370 [Candidatus Palauibacterales bacterium]|nr:hypothetical protein [Candidatus Palauibacterales bacterium]
MNPSLGILNDLDVWTLTLEGDRTPQPLLATDAQEDSGKFSPDGYWLAYSSTEPRSDDRPGRVERTGERYPDGPPKKVSTGGGRWPNWSRDGTQIFYHSTDGMMMAAEIRTEPEFADDGRFLMLKDEMAHAWPPTVNVVLNWSEKLKQRVPTGRSR